MSRERERLDEIGKKIKREAVDHGAASQATAGRAPWLNTVTPCAACKLLRRRCAQECPFSPYFSPHEPQKFASVHKVFGASNVSKMLMEVPESHRGDAANTLVYEANVRLRDPIYGCMGAILALQQQAQVLQDELNVVRAEILKHKFREASTGGGDNNNNNNDNVDMIIPSYHHAYSSGVASTSITQPHMPPVPQPFLPPAPPSLPPPSSSSLQLQALPSSSLYAQSNSSSSTHSYDNMSNNDSSYFG